MENLKLVIEIDQRLRTFLQRQAQALDFKNEADYVHHLLRLEERKSLEGDRDGDCDAYWSKRRNNFLDDRLRPRALPEDQVQDGTPEQPTAGS